MKPGLLIRTNEKIKAANEQVKKLAEKHGQRYIDVNAPLTDGQGRLKAEYTIEGMHIKPEGYRAIFDDVMKYVNEQVAVRIKSIIKISLQNRKRMENIRFLAFFSVV